jgi:hypothetical protein
MKRVGAAIVLAVFAAVALVYFNVRYAAAVSAAPPMAVHGPADGNCPQCARLSEQIDDLQRALVAIKSQLTSQQSQSGARQGVPGDTSKPPESHSVLKDVQAERAAEAEQHHVYMAGIAQAFGSEKVDSVWAGNASSRVNATFEADEALRSVTHNVACRQQTCRVEIDDDGSGKLNHTLPLIALGLADVLPSIAAERVDQGNGHSTMVLYMSSGGGGSNQEHGAVTRR